MSTTNGGPAPEPNLQPQLNVVAQYIKDFSFENPNAPQSLVPATTQPQIGIQINVGAKPMPDGNFEVTLKLDGKAEVHRQTVVRFRAGIRRHIPHPERAAGKPKRDRADRMPAPAVPVRARNHRHHRAQRRLPAAAARSGGFRRTLSPAHERSAGRHPGAADLSRRPEPQTLTVRRRPADSSATRRFRPMSRRSRGAPPGRHR